MDALYGLHFEFRYVSADRGRVPIVLIPNYDEIVTFNGVEGFVSLVKVESTMLGVPHANASVESVVGRCAHEARLSEGGIVPECD